MTTELETKIKQSINLLKSTCADELVEVAYSGGKDSDVILQLAKEASINYRAIYKNTTIDPPGTLKHVKDMGAEVMMPRNGMNFFKLIEEHGFPNRWYRHCCSFLKEYKTVPEIHKTIIGIRRDESKKRSQYYTEPTKCIGTKKDPQEAIYPILYWTINDVKDFILDRQIKVAPVYYDSKGEFIPERRLGCMCCPLASRKKRIEEFKQRPNMVNAYLRSGNIYMKTHNQKSVSQFRNVYEWFFFSLFFESLDKFFQDRDTIFGERDYKKELEKIFNIEIKDLG